MKIDSLILRIAPTQEILDAIKTATAEEINYKEDRYGKTPLHWAIFLSHFEIVKFLIEKGADVNAVNNWGETPLHDAVHRGYIVKLLLQKGAKVNAVDKDGKTPLHNAVSWGRLETVKSLLEAGANVNAVNDWGKTPLDYAKKQGNQQIVELLESYNESKNYNNDDIKNDDIKTEIINIKLIKTSDDLFHYELKIDDLENQVFLEKKEKIGDYQESITLDKEIFLKMIKKY